MKLEGNNIVTRSEDGGVRCVTVPPSLVDVARPFFDCVEPRVAFLGQELRGIVCSDLDHDRRATRVMVVLENANFTVDIDRSGEKATFVAFPIPCAQTRAQAGYAPPREEPCFG